MVHRYWRETSHFNLKFSLKVTNPLKIVHASHGLSAIAELLVQLWSPLVYINYVMGSM